MEGRHFLRGNGNYLSHIVIVTFCFKMYVQSVTHVPGAYKHSDHVWFWLFGMFVFHLLKQLAKTFSLLPRHKTK